MPLSPIVNASKKKNYDITSNKKNKGQLDDEKYKLTSSHQCSKLSTNYNMNTYFTPSQKQRKAVFDTSSTMQKKMSQIMNHSEQRINSFHPKLDMIRTSPKGRDIQVTITEEEDDWESRDKNIRKSTSTEGLNFHNVILQFEK